jgi:hypothetical protein
MNTTTNRTEIADIIANQMGGVRALKLMLGATVYASTTAPHLAFKFPNRTRSKGNLVTVTLRPDDTYDMEFLNAGKLGRKSVKKYEGVYADQLVELFEGQTGYTLRVPSFVKAGA